VLAAGVGYFAFFSIFPAVALAFTVFGFVLRGHPELLGSIADHLNQNLPGFVRDAQHPEGLIPIRPPQVATLTVHRCRRLRQPGAGRAGLAGGRP